MKEIMTVNTEVEISDIRPLICELRGQAVMLDRDLASLYHVMTGRLNEAVKRNIARFPAEFMFQLSDLEMKELIANCDRFRMMKHSPSRPPRFCRNARRGVLQRFRRASPREFGITTVDVMRGMSINPPNAWFYWAETAKFKFS